MNKTKPPQDKMYVKKDANSVDLSATYESSLKKAIHQSKQDDTSIHQQLEDDNPKNSNQLYPDEISHVKQSIKRDLIDAAQHISETGKELKDWLGFDIALIKAELWLSFTEATDKTTLELLKLKQIAAQAEYHTGEIIGLGTLTCDSCMTSLHFHKPGHIPPCSKCHGTRFHRHNINN